MSQWITLATVADIPPASWQVVEAGTVSIMLFNLDGQFYALENICTHDGGPLAEGRLECDEIICPRHGARFCVKTGAVTCPPAYEDLQTFPVRIKTGEIQVRLDQ